MKKLVLSIVAMFVISVASFGQGRFSGGLELALPMGDFADGVGTGFGVSARYEAPINDNLSWMATAGYLTFGGKSDTFIDNVSIIPVNAGLKYYFGGESFNGLYAGGELGLNFVSVKTKETDFTESGSASETEFGFAPQIGYQFGNIDISGRYAIVSDADYFGVRVAYVFGGE